MPFSDDLVAGVAVYLAAGGVGTWRASGAYLTTDASPIFDTASPGSPDRIIVLTPYVVSDDVSMGHGVQGLQVRTRGTRDDPRTVKALDDAVFDRLHGAQGITLPTGIRVVMAERTSGTPLGADGNGRHLRTANYYLTVQRPSQHRS